MSTFLNIFSSETTGPIEAKFHKEPTWDRGTKVCSNGSGHMAKMATMPICGLKKAYDLETWYAASDARVLPSLFK